MALGAPSGLAAAMDDDVVDHPSVLVRRWWPLVAVGALAGALLGAMISARQPPIWETRVQVLVGPVVADVDALEGAADLARTYGEVVQSRSVIEEATEGLGVEPSTVSVAASAGRASPTLSIRVRTPEREATPVVAQAVVDALRSTVAGSGAGGLLQTEPSLTVIDDGGGTAENQALGIELSVPLGVLAGVVLAVAAAMALEARRGASAWNSVVSDHFGRDLGILESAPALPAYVTHRYGRVIAGDQRPVHRARLVAELFASSVPERTRAGDGGADDPAVLFVGAPSGDRLRVQALLQLVAAFEPPPVLVDPDQVVSRAVGARNPAAAPLRHDLHVRGHRIALLADTSDRRLRDVESTDDVRRLCRELAGPAGTVVAFAPVDHRVPAWRHWAAAADVSLALLSAGDLDHEALRRMSTMLHAVGTPLLGGLHVRRRHVAGRSRTVAVSHDDVGVRRDEDRGAGAPAPETQR